MNPTHTCHVLAMVEVATAEEGGAFERAADPAPSVKVLCDGCGWDAPVGILEGSLAEHPPSALDWAEQVVRRHHEAEAALRGADHDLTLHVGFDWGAGVWATCTCGQRFDAPDDLAAEALEAGWTLGENTVAPEALRGWFLTTAADHRRAAGVPA